METQPRPWDPLGMEVQKQYEAAFLEKDRLQLHERMTKNEDYWKGEQNPKKSDVHPGSVTNIVMPNIESMVSDLVMEPLEILLQGWHEEDRGVAPQAQKALEWVWEKNEMTIKRDKFERQRLKFGTGIWKVYFDGMARGSLGMPVIETVNPANFFPDPKVRAHDQLHLADYIIHAVVRPKRYARRVYGSKVDKLLTEAHPSQDPSIFGESGSGIEQIAQDKLLILERWTVEEDGDGTTYLRKVVAAQGVTLYDSDEDEQRQEGYYPLDRYPFIVVPCYQQEGQLWGLSDVDYLRPTQDLVNELDDQIRMNARLMGNIQKVIGVSSGINPGTWTNEQGLNIPARDINGFKIIEPPNMSSYITNRRTEALTYEAQLITGRSDVVEGRGAGSIRAASAIISMQEAGLRRVNHKKNMSQAGLSSLFSIILDYITEYWDQEVEVGEEIMSVDGVDKQTPVSFNGRELREMPILNSSGEPMVDEETGGIMTRRASFDVTVNLGSGFLNNKSFIYQATVELVQYGIITPEEARMALKQILSWPIIDPYQPEGNLRGQQQGQGINPMDPMGMGGMSDQGQPFLELPDGGSGQGIPPELLQQMAMQLGGGNMPL